MDLGWALINNILCIESVCNITCIKEGGLRGGGKTVFQDLCSTGKKGWTQPLCPKMLQKLKLSHKV